MMPPQDEPEGRRRRTRRRRRTSRRSCPTGRGPSPTARTASPTASRFCWQRAATPTWPASRAGTHRSSGRASRATRCAGHLPAEGLQPNIPYVVRVAAPLPLLLLLLPLLLPTHHLIQPPRYEFTLSCIAELDGELRESPPSLMSEPIELPSEADEEWGITDILDKVFSPGTAASAAPGAPPEKTAAAPPGVPSPRERDRRGGAGAGTAGGAEGSASRRRRPPPPPGDECVVS